MNRTKTKSVMKTNCINCAEERKKADQSRKYAHELKNIFITISTVVESELESPHLSYSIISNQSFLPIDSGDVSPFIMEGRKPRIHSKKNTISNNNNKSDSPFYFLKTLCDYGKTLIKELNNMGKDYNNEDELEPFNISKAIDFCVDMFDTKRKYDKAKKNLQIYSDINFSYDKVIKSINETGFKMVLINLLTNSYKFTLKGKIVVRAVSIPKEKKIRIMVKDTGKGFNPNEFKKNGCFFVYERNQELNADGSGLGLTIVNDILTKFNIKLDCISSTEKGGSLFYFDLEDTYPYYDEVNPKNLMTESLSQIIKDINLGKKDNEFTNQKSIFNFKDSIIHLNKVKMNENKNEIEIKNNNINNNNDKNTNEDLSFINNNINNNDNNLNININNNNRRFSFMMSNDPNSSPKFNDNKGNENKISNNKNLNVNIYNLNNATLFSFDKESNKKGKNSEGKNDSHNNTHNNALINKTPNKKKIERMFSYQKQKSAKKEQNKFKRESRKSMLKQIIEDSNNYQKIRTFNNNINNNNSYKKGKEIQAFKKTSKVKTKPKAEEADNKKNENEIKNIDAEYNKIKKLKDENNKKNYKKMLNNNFNKTRFYLFELKTIFKKNEIYIHLSQLKNKKCITEPSSERNSPKKLKKQKSINNHNNNKIYIIICDDEEFVARSARELIITYYTKKGKEPHVYFTPNGIECIYLMYKLSIIENRKIEYILMDLEMPYLNGIKTCNIIKGINGINIPIFILSGDEPDDCKADGYCNKPLNEIDIINKLDKENKIKK